jgi:hypothetical protein
MILSLAANVDLWKCLLVLPAHVLGDEWSL